jgi:hypothetical protein
MQTEREQNDPKLFRTAARFIASPTVGGRRYWSDEVGEDKAGLLRVAASSADKPMCRMAPLWNHDRKGRAGISPWSPALTALYARLNPFPKVCKWLDRLSEHLHCELCSLLIPP